jgi:ankyrin repeat protein
MSLLGFEDVVQGIFDTCSTKKPPCTEISWKESLRVSSGRGCRDVVKILLLAGLKYGFNYTGPLSQAVDYPACVEFLLESISNLDTQPQSMRSRGIGKIMSDAVLAAVKAKNYDTLTILLHTGANPNLSIGESGKDNPLSVAITDKSFALVQLLLPVMNKRNTLDALRVMSDQNHDTFKLLVVMLKTQHTAASLFYAAKFGWLAVVKELVAKSASIEARDFFQLDPSNYWALHPLSAAARAGHHEVVKLLLEHGWDSIQEGNMDYTIQIVALQGFENIFRQLLDAGANPNELHGQYGGAFHAAAQNGHLEIVKLILQNGVDVNSLSDPHTFSGDPDCFGTAIQAAAYKGHKELVVFLLDNGANINSSSNGYPSPLQCAIVRQHVAIVDLLIQRGADIEQDICGRSHFSSNGIGPPIHCAVEAGSIYSLHLLITAGADVNSYGRTDDMLSVTALNRAVKHNKKDVTRVLLENGAHPNATSDYRDDLNWHGRDQRYRTPRQRETALQRACSLGHLDIVKILIEHGADVDQQEDNGWNALHCAANQSQYEIMAYLLHEVKANVTLTLSNGHTVLRTLIRSWFRRDCFSKCADLLLDCGCDVNEKIDGGTSLHAVDLKAEQVAYLLSKGADPSITNNDGHTPLNVMMLKAEVPRPEESSGYASEEIIMLLREFNALRGKSQI